MDEPGEITIQGSHERTFILVPFYRFVLVLIIFSPLLHAGRLEGPVAVPGTEGVVTGVETPEAAVGVWMAGVEVPRLREEGEHRR